MADVDKAEMLYDHYKETCMIQREVLATRNKLFAYMSITIIIAFLMAFQPQTVGSLIVKIVNNKFGTDITSQIKVIQSGLWVALLYVTVRYYQSSIYIERTYRYIHNLEERISGLMNDAFDREGKSYLKEYPKCIDLIDVIYKWIFPILFTIVVTCKIIMEHAVSMFFLFDGVIYLILVALTILYESFIIKNK